MEGDLYKKESELSDSKRQSQEMTDFVKYYELIKNKIASH
jgi:hypothetical protein